MLLGEKAKQHRQKESMAAILNVNTVELTELVPQMSGERLFQYVNDMLQYIGPAVDACHGTLVDISNSGVSAIFETNCEDALMSAVTICQRIVANKNEHFRFADLSIGLNYGTVYTDTVGYGSYTMPLTISLSTKVAQQMQQLASRYSAHILITDSAAKQIPGFFTKFNSRSLGHILSEETGDPQIVYDVFDGDPIERKNAKRRSKLFFETGVRQFDEGNYATARSYFIELIKTDRTDRAAKEYLYLCDRYMNPPHAESTAKETVYHG